MFVPHLMETLPIVVEIFHKKRQPQGGTKIKVRGSPESVAFILCETRISVQSFMAIRPKVGKI